jgi:hypothetical protein
MHHVAVSAARQEGSGVAYASASLSFASTFCEALQQTMRISMSAQTTAVESDGAGD